MSLDWIGTETDPLGGVDWRNVYVSRWEDNKSWDEFLRTGNAIAYPPQGWYYFSNMIDP